MLFFSCRHHVYELALKAIFEVKIKQVTTSPDIPLFKKPKDNWKNIYPTKIQCYRETERRPTPPCLMPVRHPYRLIGHGTSYRETVELFRTVTELENLLDFYGAEFKNFMARDDYRELIELSIVFLSGDAEKKFKIKLPGAMHQARWMAREIYSLKLSLFSSQLKLNTKDKEALLDVYLFIVIIYVKPWLQWILAVKATYKDLCFLKSLKAYEKVNECISKAASLKFSQDLWYFTDEIAVLALFDDDVDKETKLKMVANLRRKSFLTHEKRYIPSKEELCGSSYGQFDTLIL
ncbi:hypothetical protein AVEN_269035-1 [Araneus ventricosus]|uniref:Uncharacterized protein n=1 Tax=Araneus ventricosus TaxID=182803 RepID=A0A4Y2LEZ2_ARAVE|nr:hypothetical protein AVEN_269035-1 [Araneus ventricosus]